MNKSPSGKPGAVQLAYDMGAPFRRLLNQDEEAFDALAGWADLNTGVMAELLSWTGVRAGNVRMEFRGELYVSRALRNPVMRGCPVCLREDTAGAAGPVYTARGIAATGDDAVPPRRHVCAASTCAYSMYEVSEDCRRSQPDGPLGTHQAQSATCKSAVDSDLMYCPTFFALQTDAGWGDLTRNKVCQINS